MNINQVFPSKYIAAADLQGQQVTVTIAKVEMEPVAQNEPPKPVLYFQGKQKGMVLNKTNAANISTLYGPETDGWGGKAITLFSTYVDFQGRSVEAIRIKPQIPVPQNPAFNTPDPVAMAPAADTLPEGPEDPDDFIPF
jgi:hypothetical protein